MHRRLGPLLLGTMTVVVAIVALPQAARALTSVEGTVIGDQAPYWSTDAEPWFFPHRLGNIDNRVMLQYGSPSMLSSGQLYNTPPNQQAIGAGFVLELADQFNLGLWLSPYENVGLKNFVANGVSQTGWDKYDAPTSNLQDVDPFEAGGKDLAAGQKFDLFASYWMKPLEVGLHLWAARTHFNMQPDDSAGPINIDTDSNPATPAGATVPGRDQQLNIDKSKYSLTDWGLRLGAGYPVSPELRADASAKINFLGVNWSPNGISDYLDAGGFGYGVDLRAHYTMSNALTVGAFLGFDRQSLGFEPKRQRDGGTLKPMWTPPTSATPYPDPSRAPGSVPTGDPGQPGVENTPVAGIKYDEGNTRVQVGALARYTPVSRATLYVALGWDFNHDTNTLSVGEKWNDEQIVNRTGLPFVNLGFQGTATDYLDVFLGATKHWQWTTTTHKAFDDRIPNDGNYGTSATAPAGNEGRSNKNVREFEKEISDVDTSTTTVMLGARLHYEAFQLIGQVNPAFLQNTAYLISGAGTSPLMFWVGFIYDWDFDKDIESGNGSMKYSPHKAERKAEAPTAPSTTSAT